MPMKVMAREVITRRSNRQRVARALDMGLRSPQQQDYNMLTDNGLGHATDGVGVNWECAGSAVCRMMAKLDVGDQEQIVSLIGGWQRLPGPIREAIRILVGSANTKDP